MIVSGQTVLSGF